MRATLALLVLFLGGSAAAQRRALKVSCPEDACVISDPSENYGFIVSLNFDNADGPGGMCTGSLVSESGWVLTAAHCCVDEETLEVDPSLEVTMRFAPESKEDESAQSVIVPAEDVYPHPDFNGNDNDICLIAFDPDAIDWDELDVVNLIEGGYSTPEDFEDETVQVMGYGTTGNEEEDDSTDDIAFRTITLRTVACPEGIAQSDVICTEDLDEGDVCPGDSGGPLLWPTIVDNVPAFLQIGIVSQGPQCADRINDPDALEQDRGEGMEGTWNFIPFQSEFLCSTADLCDAWQLDDDGNPVASDEGGEEDQSPGDDDEAAAAAGGGDK